MSDIQNIRKITTYEYLETHVRAWYTGGKDKKGARFKMILGRPGTGKTMSYEPLISRDPHVDLKLTSELSAVRMYKERLFLYPDANIIFDDVDSMLKKAPLVTMLKGMTEKTKQRFASYDTAYLPDDFPRQIEVTGNILVCLNWHQGSKSKLNENVVALFDRFDVIEFAPTREEMLARMRVFAKNKLNVEVFAQMPFEYLSLRTFKNFEEWQEDIGAGIDPWRDLMGLLEITDHVQFLINQRGLNHKETVAAYKTWSRKDDDAVDKFVYRHWDEAMQLRNAKLIYDTVIKNIKNNGHKTAKKPTKPRAKRSNAGGVAYDETYDE